MSSMQFEKSRPALAMKLRTSAGFTLIELMSVIVIVAILTAIAVPSYQSYIKKAARRQAQADLVEYAQMAERFYTVNRTYVGFDLPSEQSPRLAGSTARYAMNVNPIAAGAGMSGFVITAIPVGRQTSDSCGTLTLNQAGVKTSSGGDVANCW